MKEAAMPGDNLRIGCILMASGLSERYGRDKLLEKLDGREILLHTAGNLQAAGFRPLAVTRSKEVQALAEREGIDCVLHDGPKKRSSVHNVSLTLAATGRALFRVDSTGLSFVQGRLAAGVMFLKK